MDQTEKSADVDRIKLQVNRRLHSIANLALKHRKRAHRGMSYDLGSRMGRHAMMKVRVEKDKNKSLRYYALDEDAPSTTKAGETVDASKNIEPFVLKLKSSFTFESFTQKQQSNDTKNEAEVARLQLVNSTVRLQLEDSTTSKRVASFAEKIEHDIKMHGDQFSKNSIVKPSKTLTSPLRIMQRGRLASNPKRSVSSSDSMLNESKSDKYIKQMMPIKFNWIKSEKESKKINQRRANPLVGRASFNRSSGSNTFEKRNYSMLGTRSARKRFDNVVARCGQDFVYSEDKGAPLICQPVKELLYMRESFRLHKDLAKRKRFFNALWTHEKSIVVYEKLLWHTHAGLFQTDAPSIQPKLLHQVAHTYFSWCNWLNLKAYKEDTVNHDMSKFRDVFLAHYPVYISRSIQKFLQRNFEGSSQILLDERVIYKIDSDIISILTGTRPCKYSVDALCSHAFQPSMSSHWLSFYPIANVRPPDPVIAPAIEEILTDRSTRSGGSPRHRRQPSLAPSDLTQPLKEDIHWGGEGALKEKSKLPIELFLQSLEHSVQKANRNSVLVPTKRLVNLARLSPMLLATLSPGSKQPGCANVRSRFVKLSDATLPCINGEKGAKPKLNNSQSEIIQSRADADVEKQCDDMRLKIKRTLSMGNLRATRHVAQCKRDFSEESRKSSKSPYIRQVLAISIVDRIHAMYGGGFAGGNSPGGARASHQSKKRRMLTGKALLRALMNDGLHSKLSGIPITSSGMTGEIARNVAF